ncbi:MAG: L,D-transpeptidase family protein [Gemmatimonadaceae bacterium]
MKPRAFLAPSIFAIGLSLSPLDLSAQSAIDTSLTGSIALVRTQLVAGTLVGTRWPNVEDVARDVQQAYEHVNWAPLWSSAGHPSSAAMGVVRFLTSIDALGLDPADFDARLLDSLANAVVAAPSDEELQARFEATLSVSTARALSALRWGRVRQPKAYPTLKRSREDYDLGAGVYAVSRTPEPRPVFDQAAPQWAPYRQLVAALPDARRAANHSLLLPQTSALALEAGAAFPAAPQLRELLRVLGVRADSGAPPLTADTTLDPSLARALRRFQKENRVKPSGMFDAPTRDRMRAILKARVRDAVLTLERWRWLPRTMDQKALIVNVPEYRLHVYEEVQRARQPAFSMKVVVGKGEEERQTPLFVDEVEHLIFSPYWEVPTTIAMEEIVPKLEKDSTYLQRNRYVLVRGYSDSAPVIAADTSSIRKIGKSVRVRQLPGDYNSLGRVKFMLPNHLNIYLHDTNEKHFFKRADRALSHGCIRVSEPRRLAEWILRTDTAWNDERMKKAMKADKPEKVRLTEHVPVLIVYHTAAVDEDGLLRSYRDVYKYDDELQQLLSRGYPYTR